MEQKRVDVDRLLLWQKNPRVEESNSQMEEVDNIYNFGNPSSQKTSKRQLMKLVESIAENGYQNDVEPILVVRDGENYVVQDANRRLTSIKLLRDPDKYKDILDAKDYRRLKELSEQYSANVPDRLDVVVFGDDEDETLRDILSRKHNGPLDGTGTLPWSTEAKSRFFDKKKSLSDRLEAPFEEQFGQSLTSYLGGSKAITSTRRVFGYAVVKQYLDIKDLNKVTPDELDKVKELADELKGYCQEHSVLLSRLGKEAVEQDIIIPLHEKDESTTSTPIQAMKRTSQKLLNIAATNLDRYLGYRYNKPQWIDLNNETFQPVNFLLTGLAANGKLEGEGSSRWAKAYLLAPAVRVIYELSMQALADSGVDVSLPHPVSKKHKENVDHVHDLFKNDMHFLAYLAEGRILFDSFQEARSMVTGTDFGSSVDLSQLTSHKSVKDLNIDTIVRLFEEAVLFAVLCQQYVMYKGMPSS